MNILLYVAEQCKRYFPVHEVSNMLETFLPLFTKEVCELRITFSFPSKTSLFQTALTMLPVLTSFLPPANTHLYLPALFKLWEGFNSAIFDDRLLELAGDLSEELVSGNNGIESDDVGPQWKDIGMWTEAQWSLLAGKGLGSMSKPFSPFSPIIDFTHCNTFSRRSCGCNSGNLYHHPRVVLTEISRAQGASTTGSHADAMSGKASLRVKKTINRPCLSIVYCSPLIR